MSVSDRDVIKDSIDPFLTRFGVTNNVTLVLVFSSAVTAGEIISLVLLRATF